MIIPQYVHDYDLFDGKVKAIKKSMDQSSWSCNEIASRVMTYSLLAGRIRRAFFTMLPHLNISTASYRILHILPFSLLQPFSLKALFNNVFIFFPRSWESLHAISVLGKVCK